MTTRAASPQDTAVDPAPNRWATLVAKRLSPATLGGVLLGTAGLVDSGWWGLMWAVITAAVVLVLPMTVLIVLARRGIVDTRYVRNRKHRFPVYIGVCVLILGTLAAHYVLGPVLGIPFSVTLTAAFLFLGVVVVMLVTLRWKVSAHTAMAAVFAVAIPLLVAGWLVAFTWVVPVAVAWSRIRTGDHTYWQTVVGAWIGVLIGGFYGLAWHAMI